MTDVTRVVTPPTEPPASEPALPSEPTPQEKVYAGKYKSVEELEKGYTELQKKLGERAAQTPKPADDKPKGDGLKIEPTADANTDKAVAKAGLDLNALAAEYREKGELADESYKALEDVGISREVVQTYIDGQMAIFERTADALRAIAGGKDQYQAMIEWAGANLKPDEIEVFNEAITGTPATQRMAVENLYNKFTKAEGSPPKGLVKGEGIPTSGSGYESEAQMVADMRDPRYQKDPAFRNKVLEKVKRTTAF